MRPIAFAVVMTWGCSSCGTHNGQEDDSYIDSVVDSTIDPDSDIDVIDTDVLPDSFTDPDLDTLDIADWELPDLPPPCGLVLDGPSYDLSFLDPAPVTPREPTECGECCRQITFDEYSNLSCVYDVWGRYLINHTGYSSEPSVFRTSIIDLQTLQIYLIIETNTTPDTEGVVGGALEASINNNDVYYVHAFLEPTRIVHSFIKHLNIDTGILESVFSRDYDYTYQLQPEYLRALSEWVIWTDNRNTELVVGGTQLYYLDKASMTEHHVVTTYPDRGAQEQEVHGTKIVYRDGDSDIFVYDIETDTSTRVAGEDGFDWDRYSPSIWGNIVAWHDSRNGGTDLSQTYTDIYMTDITEDGETVVCDNPASQPAALDVGDGFIVWPDARNDPTYPNVPSAATNWDLYLYDIATGTERQLTDLPGIEYCPKVFKNRVYFRMEDNYGIDSIFEITLPEYPEARE